MVDVLSAERKGAIVNTYHGDTEAQRNVGLRYEALTESIVGAVTSARLFMNYAILRGSVAPWWVFSLPSGKAQS